METNKITEKAKYLGEYADLLTYIEEAFGEGSHLGIAAAIDAVILILQIIRDMLEK